LTAKSEILPEAHAGPILLKESPLKLEGDNVVSFFSFSLAEPFFVWGYKGFKPIAIMNRQVTKRSLFMIIWFGYLLFLTPAKI
jgi:hypothetical protein